MYAVLVLFCFVTKLGGNYVLKNSIGKVMENVHQSSVKC